MEQILQLNALTDPAEVQEEVQLILNLVSDDKGINKGQTNAYFQSCYNNLKDPSPPQSKVCTLLTIKIITQKNQRGILSLLSGHPLFGYLLQQAQTIDPKKQIQQKGFDKFPKKKDIGNQYIRIILQLFVYWGITLEKNKKNQPSRFKKALNQLSQKRVVLPQQLTYFKSPPIAKLEKKQAQNTPQIKKETSKPSNIAITLSYIKNKIDGLITKLQDAQSQDDIEREVHNYHKSFQAEIEKLDQIQRQGHLIPQKVEEFFAITEFLNSQNKIYQTYIPKKDYLSYKDNIILQAQKLDGVQRTSIKPSQPKQQAVSYQEKNNSKYGNQSYNNQENMKQPSRLDHGLGIISQINKGSTNRKNALINDVQNVVDNLISRSKSKAGKGFHGIKQSIQKQQNALKAHLPRNNKSRSIGKPSRVHSFDKKKNTRDIFANPPNSNPPRKKYDGTIVPQNYNLQKILLHFDNAQGDRKFKTSSFRTKHILFQNQQIQIGYKSDPVYYDVEQFTKFISLDLFIGNKTKVQLTSLKLQFLGDQNTVLYTNPKVVQSEAYPLEQIKHELMIAPKDLPFGFMSMKISYRFQGKTIKANVALPVTILKLTQFMAIQESQLHQQFRRCDILKSQPFKLSHHFPPKSLIKQIPQLRSNIRYEQFERAGNTEDFTLYCKAMIYEIAMCYLKINVRPNLQVIIQLGSDDKAQVVQQACKSFVQNLQFVLKQTEL